MHLFECIAEKGQIRPDGRRVLAQGRSFSAQTADLPFSFSLRLDRGHAHRGDARNRLMEGTSTSWITHLRS